MGGTSVPMLSVQIAATWPKSVGTEVLPTKGGSHKRLCPRRALPQADLPASARRSSSRPRDASPHRRIHEPMPPCRRFAHAVKLDIGNRR
ncbi:DUF6053 domain-containing protein [Lysobacter enzymogenes]|uniref:DUF6053 domain-containing protein n=1 Tax=Lysobacter enzymogenes TaxID=69 RepID=UPI003CCCC0F6